MPKKRINWWKKKELIKLTLRKEPELSPFEKRWQNSGTFQQKNLIRSLVLSPSAQKRKPLSGVKKQTDGSDHGIGRGNGIVWFV